MSDNVEDNTIIALDSNSSNNNNENESIHDNDRDNESDRDDGNSDNNSTSDNSVDSEFAHIDWDHWHQPFAPVFDLLFPDCNGNQRKVKSKAAPLVDWLMHQRILTVADLRFLGGKPIWKKLPRRDSNVCGVSPIFGNVLWTDLETICNYISVYGEDAFCNSKVKYRLADKSLGAMKVAVEEYRKHAMDNFPFPNAPITYKLQCHPYPSPFIARRLLQSLFHSKTPAELRQSVEAKQEWLSKGALELMEANPLFASEFCYDPCKVKELGNRKNRLPLSYFISSGFDLAILQRLYVLYPDAMADDSSDYSFYTLLHEKLPFAILKNFMELKPELKVRRFDSITKGHLLFEFAFWSFDVSVLQELAKYLWLTGRETSLRLNMRARANMRGSELDIARTRVLECILPKLEHLEFIGDMWWTADSFLLFLEMLARGANKLKSIILTIPTKLLNPESLAALRNLMTNKPIDLKVVHFENGNWIELEKSDSCLREICKGIMDGIQSNPTWGVDKLSLKDFNRISQSSFNSLIFSDVTRSLIIRFNNCNKNYQLQVGKTNRCHLGMLDLFGFHLEGEISGNVSIEGEEVWASLWDDAAKSDRLESIFFAPDDRMAERLVTFAVTRIARLSHLKHLFLGADRSSDSSRGGTIDIKEGVNELVRRGHLEYVCIEGTGYRQRLTPAYSIDMTSLAQALPMATQLTYFALRNVHVDGRNVTAIFYDAVKTSTNLEHVEIFNQQQGRFFTFFPIASWSRKQLKGNGIVDFDNARKVEALTRRNRDLRLGLAKVRDKNTTLEEFVGLLDGIQTRFELYESELTWSMYGEGEDYHEDDDDYDEEEYLDEDHVKESNDQLFKRLVDIALWQGFTVTDPVGRIFHCIKDAPVAVSHALLRHLEVMTVKYKLLRDAPTLWCHQGSISTSGSLRGKARRKRKRMES